MRDDIIYRVDAAYALLAQGGATCNDAAAGERAIAAATQPDASRTENR